MKKKMRTEAWASINENKVIIDCSITPDNVLYLCVMEEQEAPTLKSELETIFIKLVEEKGSDNLKGYLATLDDLNRPAIGYAMKPDKVGMIATNDIDGETEVMDSDNEYLTEYIDEDKSPRIGRLKCLFGYAWSVGSRRNVYKRIDTNKWISVNQGLETEGELFDLGFKDIDGFAEDDIYAVGGHGDIWHFDGKEWQQLEFPSKKQLDLVLCAPDGEVYIAGQSGSLWKGRNNHWELLIEGKYTCPWNDMVWFQDQLWLSSEYMFCHTDGKEYRRVIDPSTNNPIPLSGRMSTNGSILVVATLVDVWTFDGKEWTCIIEPHFEE